MRHPHFLLLVLLLAITGCATIFSSSPTWPDSSQEVFFTSDPTGAEVLINGQSYGRTPLSLTLNQKKDYAITFRSEGREDRTYTLNNHVGVGWIILDLLGGVIPAVIDAATGAWYSLDDSSVHGVLPNPAQGGSNSAGENSNGNALRSAPPSTIYSNDVRPASGGIELVPNAIATISLDDGSSLGAKEVIPSSTSSVKVTLMDGTATYIGAHKIKAIVDANGVNRTKDVLEDMKRLP